MKRALTLASVFIGIPTAVSGQSTANIYLDCDVIRTYSIPDERRVAERLNFKVDQESSIIYQFDFDAGVYENTCAERDEKSDLDLMIGSCIISEESVFYSHAQNSMFFYTIQSITIFRGSGRLRGDLSMYIGPYEPRGWDPSKKPMIKYDINGSCARGKDMSAVEKAF